MGPARTYEWRDDGSTCGEQVKRIKSAMEINVWEWKGTGRETEDGMTKRLTA